METIISLITRAVQSDKLPQVLDFLLSQEECHQLEKRLQLSQMLLEGKHSQRDIALRLGISMTTITRCSNLLKNTASATRILLAKETS